MKLEMFSVFGVCVMLAKLNGQEGGFYVRGKTRADCLAQLFQLAFNHPIKLNA